MRAQILKGWARGGILAVIWASQVGCLWGWAGKTWVAEPEPGSSRLEYGLPPSFLFLQSASCITRPVLPAFDRSHTAAADYCKPSWTTTLLQTDRHEANTSLHLPPRPSSRSLCLHIICRPQLSFQTNDIPIMGPIHHLCCEHARLLFPCWVLLLGLGSLHCEFDLSLRQHSLHHRGCDKCVLLVPM